MRKEALKIEWQCYMAVCRARMEERRESEEAALAAAVETARAKVAEVARIARDANGGLCGL